MTRTLGAPNGQEGRFWGTCEVSSGRGPYLAPPFGIRGIRFFAAALLPEERNGLPDHHSNALWWRSSGHPLRLKFDQAVNVPACRPE